MTRLENIEQRLAKCSPWPWSQSGWKVDRVNGGEYSEIRSKVSSWIADVHSVNEDADLIHNSPADIAALLKVARAVRKWEMAENAMASNAALTEIHTASNELNESEG